MGNAMLAGVSGLKAHQKMLDVAGNNLANVNTYGFKSSRVTFSELLSETLREATEPTSQTGGTNPIQVGSGAQIASVDRVMTQGGMVNTGQSLDMAIEGEGYFVLDNGQTDVYTRVGSFAVDSNNYLVDPGTGYRVQRYGNEGVEEGFQTNDSVRIPFDVTLAAKATENISVSGNLNGDTSSPSTCLLGSGLKYTAGEIVSGGTLLADLDQTSGLANTDTVGITGADRAGNVVNTTFSVGGADNDASTTTLDELLTAISNAFAGSTASVVGGEIRLEDDNSGFSKTDLLLAYTGGGTFEMPAYFKVIRPGGEAVKEISKKIFDSQGIDHEFSAAFVSDSNGVWDLVITSVTGGVASLSDRRIEGITFQADGSYGGIGGVPADDPTFSLAFSNAPATAHTITMGFGAVGSGKFTVSGGTVDLSEVSFDSHDGYAAGQLASTSVTREGVLVGLFTNGISMDVASIKLAVFQNPAALESLGNNYFAVSGNSGDPVPTSGLGAGAGAVRGGSLEQSNVEIAAEFVNLIQAQNGFQANARTIKVADEMLRELSNIIR